MAIADRRRAWSVPRPHNQPSFCRAQAPQWVSEPNPMESGIKRRGDVLKRGPLNLRVCEA